MFACTREYVVFVDLDNTARLANGLVCDYCSARLTHSLLLKNFRTMRNANDMGYECLLLEDCCAATDVNNHKAAIKMVKMQGGVFGSVSDSAKLIEALSLPP